MLRTKADAEDRGEDVERAKNWDWTIEENDEWEKKKARKARRADFEFHGERTVFIMLYTWSNKRTQTMPMLLEGGIRKTWIY
jgi:hypothetical protein